MTLLACIPVIGCLTLAEVAACSLTTVNQTFALNVGTQLIFEQADGDDILVLDEATREVMVKGGHVIVTPTGTGWGTAETVLWIEETLTAADLIVPKGIASFLTANPSDNTTAAYIGGDFETYSDAANVKNIQGLFGLYGGAFHQSVGNVETVRGLEFAAWTYGGGDVNQLLGIKVLAEVFSGDIISTMIGGYLLSRNYGSGAIAAQYGLAISSIYNSGGGTVGAGYGIAIEASSGSGITTGIGLAIGDQAAATTNKAIETNAGNVIFNEGSHNDTDFRVEGATDPNLLMVDGSADTVQVGAATASDGAKFYVSGKISASGEVEINGALNHDGTELGVFATAPTTQKTVTGSRGGNAALASLLTQLAAYGLIIDSSTA